jgi:hypothetical protein
MWRMDSSVRPAPKVLEIVNENWATIVSEIINENDSKGDPWICQRQQPCWLRHSQRKLVRCRLRNHHLKTFQIWRVDSEVLAAPLDSEKVNENWVGGDWEIVNETTSKGDAWIRQRAQPLLTDKKSMKLSHYRLRNRQRNRFQRWPVDLSAPTAPVDSEIVNENGFTADSEIIT